MTTEYAIEVLQSHKSHWKRLLREKICDKKEGTNFINAVDMAISALTDKNNCVRIVENIKSEIKEWYWQADKQDIAKDPCVVDAMVDLFIRTIDKYKAESEEEE